MLHLKKIKIKNKIKNQRIEIINQIDYIVTFQCRPCNEKVMGFGKAGEQRKRDLFCFNECQYGEILKTLGKEINDLAKEKNTMLLNQFNKH